MILDRFTELVSKTNAYEWNKPNTKTLSILNKMVSNEEQILNHFYKRSHFGLQHDFYDCKLGDTMCVICFTHQLKNYLFGSFS